MYDYYARNFIEFGLIANTAAASTVVVGAWEIAHKAGVVAKAVPGWLSWGTTLADLYLAGGLLLREYAGVSLPFVDQSVQNIYPVMAGWRPQGMGPTILSGHAPRGFYE